MVSMIGLRRVQLSRLKFSPSVEAQLLNWNLIDSAWVRSDSNESDESYGGWMLSKFRKANVVRLIPLDS